MNIAIMSDSHDNIWNLRKALEVVRQEDVEIIIHCGDFVAPFMLKELDSAGIPVHGVLGNNDGDQYLLTRLSLTDLSNITLHGLVGNVEVNGFNIGFTHQEIVGRGLAFTGEYKLVCIGHSHEFEKKEIGQTILLNPGEIMGKDGKPGFCLVDSDTWDIRRIELKPGSL
jgi:putative phosphoesterase